MSASLTEKQAKAVAVQEEMIGTIFAAQENKIKQEMEAQATQTQITQAEVKDALELSKQQSVETHCNVL